MTLIERSPNLILATRLVGRFFARQQADPDIVDADPDASDAATEIDETATQDVELRHRDFGDQSDAYRLTKLIAACDAEAARIIGIAGARPGAGASLTSRQLAGAFASFGRKTLLLDTSSVPAHSEAGPSEKTSALLDRAEDVRTSLSAIDFGRELGEATLAPYEFAKAVKARAQAGDTIVIDLPAIACPDGSPNSAIREMANACDLVFLVCPTGEIRRKELSDCIETCKVVGVELNGLILNDWHLTASGLLES